jgi:hypothetical protein
MFHDTAIDLFDSRSNVTTPTTDPSVSPVFAGIARSVSLLYQKISYNQSI